MPTQIQADKVCDCALREQVPVQVDYVAVMRDNGKGGVEPDWYIEGGTAELMAGMYLCCVDGGALLFKEGSGQLYAAPLPAPMQVAAEVVPDIAENVAAEADYYRSVLRNVLRDIRDDLERGGLPDSWTGVAETISVVLSKDRALPAPSQVCAEVVHVPRELALDLEYWLGHMERDKNVVGQCTALNELRALLATSQEPSA